MWTDPIVEEVRRVREDYVARFDRDLGAIVRDLRDQSEHLKEQGWQVVSMPPKKPKERGKAA